MWTDDGRTDAAAGHAHPISSPCEPNGSGELKRRICEAERKRRERKANTNGPPAESLTLTCSTCNRQFRARIATDSLELELT